MGKSKLQYKPSIQTNRIAGETYYTSDDVAGRAFETRERLIEVYNQEKDGKR